MDLSLAVNWRLVKDLNLLEQHQSCGAIGLHEGTFGFLFQEVYACEVSLNKGHGKLSLWFFDQSQFELLTNRHGNLGTFDQEGFFVDLKSHQIIFFSVEHIINKLLFHFWISLDPEHRLAVAKLVE